MARRKSLGRQQIVWWGAAALVVAVVVWLAVRQGVVDPLRLRGDVGGGVEQENKQCKTVKKDNFRTDYVRGEATAASRKEALDAATRNAREAAAASCGGFVNRPEPWDKLRCGPSCVPKGGLSCKPARLDVPGGPYKSLDCRNKKAVLDRGRGVWHGSAECRLDCECEQACERRTAKGYFTGPVDDEVDYYEDGVRQCRSARADFLSVNFVGQGFGIAMDDDKAKAIAKEEAIKDAVKLAWDKCLFLVEKEEQFLKCEEGCETDGGVACEPHEDYLKNQCTISYTDFGNHTWGARAECSAVISLTKQCKPKTRRGLTSPTASP